jgi:hypothetical protein
MAHGPVAPLLRTILRPATAPPAGGAGAFIGTTAVTNLYIGTTAVTKLYVGTTQAWP